MNALYMVQVLKELDSNERAALSALDVKITSKINYK